MNVTGKEKGKKKDKIIQWVVTRTLPPKYD